MRAEGTTFIRTEEYAMNFHLKLPRRDFIRATAGLLAGYILLPLITGKFRKLYAAAPMPLTGDSLFVVQGNDISKDTIFRMIEKGFAGIGDVGRFVKKGMNVVIKPNIGWNSSPEMPHNTNPYMVEAVARTCVRAGARVTIFDRSVNSARLTYRASGIRQAAENAGADIVFVDDRKFRTVRVPGALLHSTLHVYEDILNADCVINMPVAKHHSSSTLTLSMKNLMGVLGGNRGIYHGDIHSSIVDFNKAIKAHLVIMDATRILLRHGPNGGTQRDVRETKTIVFGTNPVTVDAFTATLFGMKPRDLMFLALASKEGMGEIDTSRMKITRASV